MAYHFLSPVLVSFFALLSLGYSSASSSTNNNQATGIIQGRLKLPDPTTLLNSTRITLNDGTTHNTYTQPDGSFIFYRVPPGVHLLDVQSRTHHFSQVKIQLLEETMDSPKCIEYIYPGSPKQAIPHPLELVAHASYEYYEPRQGFSIFSILRNPMLLMMIVSVGGMVLMPKMMESLDPEQKEQMQKQMAMQQDPSKMFTQMFADITGTGEEDAPPQNEKKPSSKAGGKTRRGDLFDVSSQDVSCGANGALSIKDKDGNPIEPITKPFSKFKDGLGPLCPANLHFHIGAEHRSVGEYDEAFDFDNFTNGPKYTSVNFPQDKSFSGKRCNFYKERESNGLDFSNYNFKYCVDVKVGETYEFHWPHSSLAACGDYINQYQEPFVDGLLCNDPFGDDFDTLVKALSGTPQLLPQNIGVQAQIVTVVNEERYFFPNFVQGMIINRGRGCGQDITAYTGSRTGGGFGANLDSERPCDPVSPVSWQVDRKCQLVSASTLDQMCRDVMSNPGMRACGDGCDGFPIAGLFKVDDEEDENFGVCCYPATRPATSRGVVVEQLQADNVQDISGTCP